LIVFFVKKYISSHVADALIQALTTVKNLTCYCILLLLCSLFNHNSATEMKTSALS